MTEQYRTTPVADRLTLGVALAALLLPTYFAWSSQADETEPTASPTPGPTSPPSLRSTPGDGGAVRIVEHGFTPVRDTRDDHQVVTWGLIVENTSKTMAAQVPVTITFLDDDGEPLENDAGDRIIGSLMPGTRSGIGAFTYVERAGTEKLRFDLGPTKWLPSTDPRMAHLTADGIKGTLYAVVKDRLHPLPGPRIEAHRDHRHDLDLTFTVHSRHPKVLFNPHATAIFRDQRGDVIGGTSPNDTDLHARFPPGWSIQKISASHVPPAIDVSRTEVHPHARCCLLTP